MVLDIIIDIHPERIRNLIELDEIILKIKTFENDTKSYAGVGLKQNKHLGGSYRIVYGTEVESKNSEKYEWYVKFYPLSYFEVLKNSKEFLACSKTIE